MHPRGFQVINGQLADHDMFGFWTVGDTPDPSIPNLALEDPPTGGGAEALSGTAALTLTATGGLTSATALTGAATLAITADGALVATTSLSGEATLALTATGNLDAATVLSGSASLALNATGDMTVAAPAATGTSAGSYNMYRTAPDDPPPRKVKYVGPAPQRLVTKTPRAAKATKIPAYLADIEKGKLAARQSRGAKLRAMQMADDEWLMLN